VEEEDREGQVGKERDDAGRVGGGTGWERDMTLTVDQCWQV